MAKLESSLSERLRKNPAWIAITLLVLWVSFCFLFSAISGWRSLSENYPASRNFEGSKWHMQSATIGWVRYRSCLTVGTGKDSLYLSIVPAFRLWHPPLEIPYDSINGTEVKGLPGFNNVILTLDEGGDINIVVSRGQADRFESASRNAWHYERG